MALTIKTLKQIEGEIVQAVATSTAKATFFGNNGVVKAIIKALAAQIRDLYHILSRTARTRYLDTATGSALGNLVSEYGIRRETANPASVVLVFRGPVGAHVIEGTPVQATTTQITYKTKNLLVIGTKNPELLGIAESIGLGDAVLAEAEVLGTIGNAPIDVITVSPGLHPSITVTNPAPARGGLDAETDEQLRERARNRISLLNQGTQAFYEALARESDSRVLRAIAQANPSNDGVNLFLVSKSGANFTQNELNAIAAMIYDRQRAFTNVQCSNIAFTGVFVQFETLLDPGYTLDDVYTSVGDAIADFIDFQKWGFGIRVQDDDILDVINGIEGIGNINLSTYKLNGSLSDVLVPSDSLPRFVRLQITDTGSQTTKDVLLTQGYI